MNTCYIDTATRSIADLIDFDLGGLLLTRINVPVAHRGQGHARKLLARILADADREGVTLWLQISPSDGLDYRQLASWYMRRGFHHHEEGLYQRLPHFADASGRDLGTSVSGAAPRPDGPWRDNK